MTKKEKQKMKIPAEKMEIQKFEYLYNENSYLDEIKNIFHTCLGTFIWWKNEKQQTQALAFSLWTKNIQFDSQNYTVRQHLQYGL